VQKIQWWVSEIQNSDGNPPVTLLPALYYQQKCKVM